MRRKLRVRNVLPSRKAKTPCVRYGRRSKQRQVEGNGGGASTTRFHGRQWQCVTVHVQCVLLGVVRRACEWRRLYLLFRGRPPKQPTQL